MTIRSNLGELTQGLMRFKKEFLAVGTLSLIVNVLMLSPTLFQLQITDRIFISRSATSLITLSVIILFFFLVMGINEWIRSILLIRAGISFDNLFGSRVFNAVFDSQLKQITHNPTEALSDLTNIRQFLTGNGIFAFFDAPWTPIYVIVVWMMNPLLGKVALAFVCMMFIQGVWNNQIAKGPSQRVMESGRRTAFDVASKLRNIEAIEAMGMRPNLKAHWLGRYSNDLALNIKLEGMTHRALSLSKFMRYCQQSLILAVGALLVIENELTAGQMIAVSVLMQRALQPMDMIVSSWQQFANALISFGRLDGLLRANPVAVRPVTLGVCDGAISVSNLVVLPKGRHKPIVNIAECRFEPGTVTAILGASGSGKTTFAKCILGICPGATGSVKVSGVGLESIDRESLGEQIGYLPQDVELLDGTISENIARFGVVNPDLVIDAATRVGIKETVFRLPNGFDTPFQDALAMLSAGQRQRVGLARAVYGVPKIVVLDEPNSNLDDVGERALVSLVGELKSLGCTVILIAHRPGVLGAADRFVIMESGEIKQTLSKEQISAQQNTALTE